MITIACVLHQSVDGIYHPLHVQRLRRQVEPYAPEHRFVCLTNAPHWEQPEGIERIPLEDGNHGWWAKIELFRPGLFDDRVLYLDLDVEVVGDLRPIIEYPAPFASIKDYINKSQINSSVMVFDPGAGAAAYTSDPPITDWHGDQGFISAAIPDIERFPVSWCPSYKVHVKRFGCPPDAKVIVYHGTPRPWSQQVSDERASLVRKGKLLA